MKPTLVARIKNKHADKKLHAGRGGVGKAVVVGAKDRATNRISATVVQDTKGDMLKVFVRTRSTVDSQIYTDDNRAYLGLDNHETVCIASVNMFTSRLTQTVLKASGPCSNGVITALIHHMSEKHLDRYVGEFAGRHNERNSDTIDQMAAIARRMIGRRLRYRELAA